MMTKDEFNQRLAVARALSSEILSFLKEIKDLEKDGKAVAKDAQAIYYEWQSSQQLIDLMVRNIRDDDLLVWCEERVKAKRDKANEYLNTLVFASLVGGGR